MRNRGGAVFSLEGECRRHRVGRLVIRVQAKQLLQERKGLGAAGLEFKLCSGFQRGDVVRVDLERVLEGQQTLVGGPGPGGRSLVMSRRVDRWDGRGLTPGPGAGPAHCRGTEALARWTAESKQGWFAREWTRQSRTKRRRKKSKREPRIARGDWPRPGQSRISAAEIKGTETCASSGPALAPTASSARAAPATGNANYSPFRGRPVPGWGGGN